MSQQISKENAKSVVPLNSKSSCIAWFKLADLISRNEKEKALSLYRLLSHSFDEKAYALQLEGDILWFLEDKLAIEKYKQAAFLYKQEQKHINAIAIYEHLLTLQPQNCDFLYKLMILYAILPWQEKFEQHYSNVLECLDNRLLSTEQVLFISKKILDLFIEKIAPKAEEDFLFKILDKTKIKWVKATMSSVLQSRNCLKIEENLNEYCLEHKLNFDA